MKCRHANDPKISWIHYSVMIKIKTRSKFIPRKSSQLTMLTLLFVWSIAQPLAVIDSVPIEIRYKLFFWKNVIGLVVISFGAWIILANLAKRRYPYINIKLFWISLGFPFFSLFNMLFRGHGTSIEEQVLYFLWPLALFIIFPTFFPTLEEQRKGIFVILMANLMALVYAIVPYAGQEDITNWLSYSYRLDFGFLQPNIYSSSWAVVFICSLYFYLIWRSQRKKKYLLILCTVALLSIFLARSESAILFCSGQLLLFLNFLRKQIDKYLLACFAVIAFVALFIPFTNIVLDPVKLDDTISGRMEIWSRSVSLNMGRDSIFDLLFGKASLISGNPLYTGDRVGFQAMRAQADNAYLAKFLQNGFIGCFLYFAPFVIMLNSFFRQRRFARGVEKRLFAWIIGIWFGVFFALIGLDVIPSFGNVLNIFLFVASAPAIAMVPKATHQ